MPREGMILVRPRWRAVSVSVPEGPEPHYCKCNVRGIMRDPYSKLIELSKVKGTVALWEEPLEAYPGPVIFPRKYMDQLITEGSLLNGTIYRDNGELSYQLGEAVVVSQEYRDGDFFLYVVISLPDLGQQE